MANLVNGSCSPGPKIVIGLDYGTTYTGLAWAHSKNATQALSLADVKVFRKWPARSELKVPSAKSYSWSAKGRAQWGFDIDDHSKIFKWTKLELVPRKAVAELKVLADLVKGLELTNNIGHEANDDDAAKEVPQHLTKTPEEILENYLSEVSREWYRDMVATSAYVFDNVPVDIVITHPVNWPYVALNSLFRAAMAVFPKRMYPRLRDVYMTTEPEACANYTVQKMMSEQHRNLIRGDCFVLCDGGGGTVDVASYLVENLSPLKLIRMGNLKGRECGATFIDRAFLDFVSKKPHHDNIIEKDSTSGGHFIVKPAGSYLLQEFEKYKHGFTGTGDALINCPPLPDRAQKPANASLLSSDSDVGQIQIENKNLKEMFKKSVTGTLELIRRQVFEIEQLTHGGGHCHVSTIFLAGGLSGNKYLTKKVEEFARGHPGCISVKPSDDAWSAVVQGAVVTGAQIGGAHVPPKVSQAQRNYGTSTSQIYEAYKFGNANVVTNKYTGREMVRDPISWLIQQGDLIPTDGGLKKYYAVECTFGRKDHDNDGLVRITFVVVRMGEKGAVNDAPVRLSEVDKKSNTVVYMDIPLTIFNLQELDKERRADGKGKYYSVRVNVKVHVSTEVKVDVVYRGRSIYAHQSSL